MTEEPALILACKTALELGGDFGATVTSDGPFPQIGVRPELLSRQLSGLSVWRLNPKQCKKIIKLWNEEMEKTQ